MASLILNKTHCGTEHIFNLSSQVLRGLIGLHGAGLVHGDIKPANIVLSGGVYKLCDIDEAGQTTLNGSKGREFNFGFRNSVFLFPGIIKWKRPNFEQIFLHLVRTTQSIMYVPLNVNTF